MSSTAKYDRLAHGFSDREYADPQGYAARRAQVAVETGPPLPVGASVLDLGCGDATIAKPLLALGLRYRGVDASAVMVDEARARLGASVPLEVARIEEYAPPEPVDLTLCLRTVYSLADRRAVFHRIAAYTRVKLVFDFDPRAVDRRAVLADLAAAGLAAVELRPFFLPQRVAVPRALRAALTGLERTGPLAQAALHVRGILFCSASSSAAR